MRKELLRHGKKLRKRKTAAPAGTAALPVSLSDRIDRGETLSNGSVRSDALSADTGNVSHYITAERRCILQYASQNRIKRLSRSEIPLKSGRAPQRRKRIPEISSAICGRNTADSLHIRPLPLFQNVRGYASQKKAPRHLDNCINMRHPLHLFSDAGVRIS